MKILIVDDNDRKRQDVRETLASGLFGAVEIVEALRYEDALNYLAASYYDLVILDLVLPAAGQDPSPDTARAIIREVVRGSTTIPPMHIIGLTAYGEVAEAERSFYETNLFALVIYSEVSTSWRSTLIAKIEYLLKSKAAAAAFQENSFDYDIVVVAARYKNEFRPVKHTLFRSVEADAHPRWRGPLAIGPVKAPGLRALKTVLCCTEETGMAPSAAIASQAISVFRPRLIAMLGMCCGFGVRECALPRKLLDVIVVREVNCWEEGKYDASGGGDGFLNRGRDRMIDPEILPQVETAIEASEDIFVPTLTKLSASVKYRKILEHFGTDLVRQIPDVQLSALVSGSSVVADRSVVLKIIDRNPKALGMDMEMYGVYSAAAKAMGRRPSVLGVKGVADFGEIQKDDTAQEVASVAATMVFKQLLGELRIW